MSWRLLEYSASKPKMNLAIDEAILRARQKGLCSDTLRLWQNPKSVIIGPGPIEYHVDLYACRKYDVEIVRTISVEGKALYHDFGNLNFTVVTNPTTFRSLITDYRPVLSEYQLLSECVVKRLRKLGVDARTSRLGANVEDRKISGAFPFWFHDLLLLQGTLFVDTNINVFEDVVKLREAITSLSQELGGTISMDDVRRAVTLGFEEKLDVKFEAQGLTKAEQDLVATLYSVKYSTARWNVEGIAPLALGKTLVEVYVAHPPTSKCRELIRLVSDATADLLEKVKVVVWRRGMGYPPGVGLTIGLRKAAKARIIPAVIINGGLKFGKTIPSRDQLRRAILAPESVPNIDPLRAS